MKDLGCSTICLFKFHPSNHPASLPSRHINAYLLFSNTKRCVCEFIQSNSRDFFLHENNRGEIRIVLHAHQQRFIIYSTTKIWNKICVSWIHFYYFCLGKIFHCGLLLFISTMLFGWLFFSGSTKVNLNKTLNRHFLRM